MVSEKRPVGAEKTRDIEDIFIVALPDPIAMDWRLGGHHREQVMAWLDYHAKLKVLTQWQTMFPVPKDVEIAKIDFWLTDSAHDAGQFVPAHDCDDCREGVQKAVTFLEDARTRLDEDPEANKGLAMPVIAFANIKYKEHWA